MREKQILRKQLGERILSVRREQRKMDMQSARLKRQIRKDPERVGYIHSYRICMDHLIEVENVAAIEFCGAIINVQQ